MAHLLIQNGAGSAQRHDLNGDLITIGRHPENTIVLDHPSVSNRHAEIVDRAGKTILRDLGSVNGTRVNEAQIHEVQLADGDRIEFGPVTCLVDIADETEQPALSQPSELPKTWNKEATRLQSKRASVRWRRKIRVRIYRAKRNAELQTAQAIRVLRMLVQKLWPLVFLWCKRIAALIKRGSHLVALRVRIEKLKLLEYNKTRHGFRKKRHESFGEPQKESYLPISKAANISISQWCWKWRLGIALLWPICLISIGWLNSKRSRLQLSGQERAMPAAPVESSRATARVDTPPEVSSLTQTTDHDLEMLYDMLPSIELCRKAGRNNPSLVIEYMTAMRRQKQTIDSSEYAVGRIFLEYCIRRIEAERAGVRSSRTFREAVEEFIKSGSSPFMSEFYGELGIIVLKDLPADRDRACRKLLQEQFDKYYALCGRDADPRFLLV